MRISRTIYAALLAIATALYSGSAAAQVAPNIGPITVTTVDSVGRSTAPPNPVNNKCRSYYNTSSGQMTWINSSGNPCGPSGGGGGPLIEINGTPNALQNVLNFLPYNGPGGLTLNWTNPGGTGSLQPTIVLPANSSAITYSDSLNNDSSPANAYANCPGTPNPGLAAGLIVHFQVFTANTGASTYNMCSTGAFPITKLGGVPLTAGDIPANSAVTMQYLNNGNWYLFNPAASAVVPLNLIVNSVTDGLTTDTGSTNAYASCPGSPNPALGTGLQVHFVAVNTNTGTSTYSMCGNTATSIVKNGGVNLIAGDIAAGGDVYLQQLPNGKWQDFNPMSSASGSLSGQQQGQPTFGLTATTVGTANATFHALAFSGTDLCDKINKALLACPTGSVNSCRIIVDPTSPGSADVCASGTSNFWSGVNTQLIVAMDLNTILQLKQPVVFPAAAHIVRGIGSNQNFFGAGFRMDPAFSDPNNFCSFTSGVNGPFPTGNYKCLIIDGGTNFSNNAFGGWWEHLLLDCNYVPNCIGYYTGNMQEGSGLDGVRCWHTGVNSGTGSVSACGFWDHSVALTGNSGPSHFRVLHSFIDPWPNAAGNNSNGITYGWVYEANSASGNSGGNVLFSGGTIRGGSTPACAGGGTCFMEDAVWIHGSAGANVEDIHCEWMNTDCISIKSCSECKASNITNVNHASNAVHFDNQSTGGIAYAIQSGAAEVQDDLNGCTSGGATLGFYTQDDGGQGWWNGGFHVCKAGNTDRAGALAFTASTTSATYTFTGSYGSSLNCVLTPQSSPGTTQFWPTISGGVLTLHATASVTITVNYSCTGRGT